MSDIPPILDTLLAGRYVLRREIGRGGAATVYLAHDERHERQVAVKVLHPELSHALGAQRFLREIKLTASLQHPHILSIHDSGEVGGQLFYVMPYVEGDSLRQRLGADNRLSIDEAVRVGREVAGALAYAHERGVIHRDIKPENILFSGGHAVLADFGIARAINRATEKITQQGMITGTPAYMSPEQARDRAFDGRSDVYSLACVLYEAIAGVPPFVGDTPQQLLAQRVAKTPPLLRQFRHDVPAAIETVIARALAISPDDRYADARAFSAALSAAIGNSGETLAPTTRRRRPLARHPLAWAAGITLLVAGGAATTAGGRDRIDLLTRRVDTAQYAVIPFQYVGAPTPAADAEPAALAVYDAMRQWDGLHLASELGVSDALARYGGEPLTLAEANRVARAVRAGRAVWGRVRVAPESVVVRAGVYDALTGESLREVTRVVRPGTAAGIHGVDFRALANELLRSAPVALSLGAERGTSSFAAWQAFERGAAAVRRWELGPASDAFAGAVAADPTYPQANLWLAQTRYWQHAPVKEWSAAYLAAEHARPSLDPREQRLADALGAVARSDHPAACRAYDALRGRDSLDAIAWLGLAFCNADDGVVVPSTRSPTGMAFRGSMETAWRAVSRALDLAPEAFAIVPYESLRRILPIEHNRIRLGYVGANAYGAAPALDHDTVAWAAMPMAQYATAPTPAGYDAALRFDRDRMLGLLETRDEITGTPNGRWSALTALERARALSTDPDQRIRLAVADARLHLKLGDFGRAAATTDSVLRAQERPTASQAYLLTGLAAFVGRPGLAATYRRLSGQRDYRGDSEAVPAADDALAELLMRSALGICGDSLRTLIGSVDHTLASYVPPAQRRSLRDGLLERSLMLGAPCDGGRSTLQLQRVTAPIVRVQQAAGRGDRAAVRRMLDSIEASRRAMRPGALAFDLVVQEAWLRDFAGDPRAAADRLDVTLSALPTLSTYVLTEPVMAAAVGRGMAYRAELAARLGDPGGAALWAGRTLTLWGHAEGSLEPAVARMRMLAATHGAR